MAWICLLGTISSPAKLERLANWTCNVCWMTTTEAPEMQHHHARRELASIASVTVPIWLTLSNRLFTAFCPMALLILLGFVQSMSSPMTCRIQKNMYWIRQLLRELQLRKCFKLHCNQNSTCEYLEVSTEIAEALHSNFQALHFNRWN